ncbi:aminopeptidase N [Actinoplanes sp. NBRC 103695]|uniref:aminopeptidase N n=1 Tax=Actinoplanes sp. NBRC 103695 TaxID=3032202 RepID=UPI0024A205A4|nr:aminopeptidase N [Actinoplanes sp. NBRC 103695]GLZ00892.1 aminopeptidase [Actinoplanes sp. NBRC 103695]
MPSLTRAEAAERAATIDVESYEIDLDLTDPAGSFLSRTTVRFTATPGSSTFADLEPAELVAATLNGSPIDPATLADKRLPLTGLAAANELVVEARMRYSNDCEGLHRYVDPSDKRTYLYANLFLDAARKVFACFDQPDLKAPYTLRVTAAPEWTVAANGEVARSADGRWEFVQTAPLATYFVSLLAGPYHVARDEHAGLPLAIYARQSLAEHLDAEAAELFEITKQCLDRYAELFEIPYPFGHYQQAFVPEFNAGAMENPGLVTFRDEFIYESAVTDSERAMRANVIAHEMAHMWFGDLVTMTWWDDLWLNESFAEYMGSRITAEATRFSGAWTSFAVGRKSWGLRADQRPSTHPVAPSRVDDTELALLNFDGISYAKGACVLKQLVAFLGDEAFLSGVNAHFGAHRFGNATLADLLDALTTASGRDLSAWAEAWLRTAQVNVLRTEVSLADDGTYAEVAVVQTAHEQYPVLRPHRLALGVYDRAADGTVGRRELIEVDLPAGVERTVLPELTGAPAADLLLLNDGDLGYAKIRLDDASLANVPMMLPLLGDSLARAVIWSAIIDAVKDGERPVAELVTLVLAALPMETEVVVVEDVLAMTRNLVDRYATPETRPAALELLAQACDRLLTVAEAGGSQQLAAARALIASTVDTARIRGWLSDEGAPEGLAVDAELRWLILYRLVKLGAAAEAEIEAEYARDRTATGERFSLRCRAALPTAEAKAAAWHKIIADADGTSARMAEAAAAGFWQPEQTALTDPYVARYFAEMPEMFRVRGGIGAEVISISLYPSFAVAESTRDLAAGLLAEPDLNATLRRTVIDSDDDMRKALLARG